MAEGGRERGETAVALVKIIPASKGDVTSASALKTSTGRKIHLDGAASAALSDSKKPAVGKRTRECSPEEVETNKKVKSEKPETSELTCPKGSSRPLETISEPRDSSAPRSISAPRDNSAPLDNSAPPVYGAPRDTKAPPVNGARPVNIAPRDNRAPRDNSAPRDESAPRDNSEPRVNSVPEAACQLAAWGLPDTILAQYAEKGVTTMFPWQVE